MNALRRQYDSDGHRGVERIGGGISAKESVRQVLATAIIGMLIASGVAHARQQRVGGKVSSLSGTANQSPSAGGTNPVIHLANPVKVTRSPDKTNNAYDIMDYGATCDGRADDTAVIQFVYSLLTSKTGGGIHWPGGTHTCKITSTITLTNSQSVRIAGGRVLWGGNAENPVFSYINDRNVTTQGFFISPAHAATTPIGTAFDIRENTGRGFGISSGNIFDGNVIEGVSSGGLNIGFEQAQGTAGNANNDQMRYYGNEVRNYTSSGWKIDHNQATDDYFSGNQCYGDNVGARCLDNTLGAAFSWFGGGTFGNTVADFVTSSNASAPTTIESVNSEGSNRFVLSGSAGPAANPSPLNLIGDRFSTNALNGDGHCVTVNNPGPMNVIGGSYGQGNMPCNFYWNPSQATYHSIFGQIVGVTSSGASSAGTPLLAYARGITVVGVLVADNVYTDGSGHAIPATALETAKFGSVSASILTGTTQIAGPVYQAKVDALAQTMAIGTTTLHTTPEANGAYLINAALSCTTSSPAATVTLTVNWTDTSNTAQNTTTSPATCTALGSRSYISITSLMLNVKASTIISFFTTIVNTPTYDLRIAVEGPW